MQLSLVVPGLLDLPAHVLAAIDAEAPALSRLIASSPAPETESDGLLGAACRACGIERQRDWPVAPRLAHAFGIEPAGAYWLCADPVTLVAGADDVRLSGVVDDLPLEDARALAATLNAHFERDGIEFVVGDAARWFVRAPDVQRLSTHPPEAALDAPLFEFLPRGEDAARWRRWLNESQMILFDHAVNQRRQADNSAPANSIWPWGGGTNQPPASRSRGTRIFGGGSRMRELARGSGLEPAPLPASFAALAALVRSAPAVVWLDRLVPESAMRALGPIDRAWAAPASRALDAGSLSIEVVAGGRARAQRFEPRRATLSQRVRARFALPRGSAVLLSEARESRAV